MRSDGQFQRMCVPKIYAIRPIFEVSINYSLFVILQFMQNLDAALFVLYLSYFKIVFNENKCVREVY